MFSDRIALQIANAATAAGIPPAGMLALVEVETAGQPTENDGRTPNFLFERHLFHRELSARAPDKLAAAVRAGYAIPKWNKATQYRDEGTSSGKLALLAKVKAIDEDCALRACSWGLPQILGSECHEVGFNSSTDMVDFLTRGGVPAHVELMIRFLKGRHLVGSIQNKDWAYVALRYNGAGYAKNQYDTRLAAAERKWSRKLPVLMSGGGATEYPEEHLSKEEIEAIQTKLRQLAYHEVGDPDGRWGSRTTGAIAAFQTHEGLPVTGHYDEATKDALDIADARPVSDSRANATLDDLREQGSTTIASADTASTLGKVKTIGGIVVAGGAAAEQAGTVLSTAQDTVDKVDQAKTLWGSIHHMLHPIFGHPAVLIIAVAVAIGGFLVWKYADRVKLRRLIDHQTGTHPGTLEA